MDSEEFSKHVKAMNLKDGMVLFVDRNQIHHETFSHIKNLPRVIVVFTSGPPNVQAMTKEDLKAILRIHA